MTRYLETAEDLRKEVREFLVQYCGHLPTLGLRQAVVQLGHIINLAIRCSPRPVQGTCRKNIVAKAMQDYCDVRMTRERDPDTGRDYNKIHINPKKS
jgi:hypothetical protein